MARTVLDLSTPALPVGLMDWGDYRIETGATVSPAGIAAASGSGWQPTQPEAIYPLTTGQALWIRFTLPPAPDAERWYLEIPLVPGDSLFIGQPGIALYPGQCLAVE